MTRAKHTTTLNFGPSHELLPKFPQIMQVAQREGPRSGQSLTHSDPIVCIQTTDKIGPSFPSRIYKGRLQFLFRITRKSNVMEVVLGESLWNE